MCECDCECARVRVYMYVCEKRRGCESGVSKSDSGSREFSRALGLGWRGGKNGRYYEMMVSG